MDGRVKEIDLFKLADSAIEKAYPNILDRKEKGWWGAKRIPNFGILRGAIVSLLSDQEKKIEELASIIASKNRITEGYIDKRRELEKKIEELEAFQREQEEIVLGVGPIKCSNGFFHEREMDDCMYCIIDRAEAKIKERLINWWKNKKR